MKLNQFILSILLLFSISSNANNVAPPTGEPDGNKTESSVFSKIFIEDYENTMLFIDFAVAHTTFQTLNIYHNSTLVKQEDLTDLPEETIYEINFEELQKGEKYTLELKTNDGIAIVKDFTVN